MSMLTALFLLPMTASAEDLEHSSTVVPLLFSDHFDAFEALEVDTGSLPSGSPLAVRFYIKSRGGSYAEFLTESHLAWPPALTQFLHGVPETGLLDVACDLELTAQVTFDLWGYRGAYDVWSERLKLQREAFFDPNLLPDDSPPQVQVVADGEGLVEPYQLDIPLFAGLELRFEVETFPRVTGRLQGRRFETNGYDVISSTQGLPHDVPEQDPGVLELTTTFVADSSAALDLVLRPSMEICAPFVGCFRVARFDVPIPMVDRTVTRSFAPIDYEHPLPALVAPVSTHDFGDQLVSTLANLQLPLENIGRLPLEGTAEIEGDPSFSVFPEYFFATEGAADGTVVTFDPTEAGAKTATLVIRSNDPRNPELRIPLAGNGFEPPVRDDEDADSDRLSGEVGCGCDTASPFGAGWALGLSALLIGLRRRR